MKTLFATGALAFVLLTIAVPVIHARSGDDKYTKDGDGKHWTRASEMASLGLAFAVVTGGAGYLLLRRQTRRDE